jgi:thiol-disulfide isomerase/thioredoxin
MFINSHFFQQTEQLTTDQKGRLKVQIPRQATIQEVSLTIDSIFHGNILISNGVKLQFDDDRNHSVIFAGPDSEMNRYYQHYKTEKVEIVESKDSTKHAPAMFLENLNLNLANAMRSDSIFIARNPSRYSYLILEDRKAYYFSKILAYYWSSGIELDKNLISLIYSFEPKALTNNTSYYYYCLHTYIKRSIIFPKYIKEGIPNFNSNDWSEIKSYQSIIKDFSNFSEKDLIAKLNDEIVVFLLKRIASYCDGAFIGNHRDKVKMPVNLANDNQYKLYYEEILSQMSNHNLIAEAKRIYDTKLNNIALINIEYDKAEKLDSIDDIGILKMRTDFNAQLYVFKGNSEFELLNTIRREFHNKAILMDFWAVWCEPCLKAMPYSKALMQNSSKVPIQFVYLCTSNSTNEANWKTKIIQLKQPGIHIFVEDSLIKRLMERLQISGYPGYILFKSNSLVPQKLSDIKDLSFTDLVKKLQE